MLRCPYCRTALTENTAACPHCALDLARATAVLGPIPRLSASGLSDLAGVLRTGQPEKILRLLDDFQFRFPQSRLAVVLRNFDPKLPLATHLYWLFNVAPVSGKGNPGGTNRDILIGIDPQRQSAALTVGYGLEPLLSESSLEEILSQARPHFRTGDYLGGIRDLVRELSTLLSDISRDLPEILGLGPVKKDDSSVEY